MTKGIKRNHLRAVLRKATRHCIRPPFPRTAARFSKHKASLRAAFVKVARKVFRPPFGSFTAQNFKQNRYFITAVALFVAVIMTLSVSTAMHRSRMRYTLKLAMAEHFSFAAGELHAFEIPYDGYYAFKLWGGDGGDSKNSWNNGAAIYELGGKGGEVAAVSFFVKGTVLTIVVGTKGETTAGGYNGGGGGGAYLLPVFNDYFGGGGGGASDVRINTGTLDDRILVAGGGGGGSGGSIAGNGSGYTPNYGGNGGAENGNYAGANGIGDGFGQGGGLVAGGDGYQSGWFGFGGYGNYSGGGGGGGYYGGGGSYGSGGGGGGGSAFVDEMFTVGVPKGLPDRDDYITNGRDGFVIISFLGNRYFSNELPAEEEIHYEESEAALIPEPEATPEPEAGVILSFFR